MTDQTWHERLLQELTLNCGVPKDFVCKADTVEVEYPGMMLYVPFDADIKEAVEQVLMVLEEGGETVH